MTRKYARPTLVINTKREFFAAIVAGRKKVEYRELSDYWLRRLETVGPAPFDLRLLNGMTRPVPEATVRVKNVKHNQRSGQLEFQLGYVLEAKDWDRRREKPRR